MGNSHICAFHPSFYNRIESHRMGNRPHISDTTTRRAIFMQPSHVTVGEPSALLHIFKALYHPIYSYKTAPLSTVPEQDARKWIEKRRAFWQGRQQHHSGIYLRHHNASTPPIPTTTQAPSGKEPARIPLTCHPARPTTN